MDRYEFIWKAIQKHGYKYDYGKVNYVNYNTKVCIICPIHGEFWQTPSNHLHIKKYGCIKCSNTKKYTTKEFIEKAKDIHGDNYDYSKVDYINAHTKVCIICHKKDKNFNEHGEFWQTPHIHLSKKGCPICSLKKNIGEKFIFNELLKSFDKNEIIYQYRNKNLLGTLSLDFYLPSYNIAIECQGLQHFEHVKIFGNEKTFYETCQRDIKKYETCKKYNIEIVYFVFPKKYIKSSYIGKTFNNINDLIKYIKLKDYNKHNIVTDIVSKFKLIHGNKYDYSKVDYINNKTKVCIICHEKDKNGVEHGEFWQAPNIHLNGSGCVKCVHDKHKLTTEEFIEKTKSIHKGKYDYSKTEYINTATKVCIICHEKDKNGVEHGVFWQTPNNHLNGHGCPKCKNSFLNKINKISTKEWINKAKKVHGNRFDYSKVVYKGAKIKVCIICHEKDGNDNEYGEFWQRPDRHLNSKRFIINGKILKIK